jgi:DNA-directed RNA polymerase specialized sigma24 family protein
MEITLKQFRKLSWAERVSLPKEEIEALFRQCKSEHQRESFNDLLIKVGTRQGVYNQFELNVRVAGHEVPLTRRDPETGEEIDLTNLLPVAMSDAEAARIIGNCARAGLSRQLRVTWVLHWDGYTAREIGIRLHLCPSSVRMRIAKARHRLAQMLDWDVRWVYRQECRRGKRNERVRIVK